MQFILMAIAIVLVLVTVAIARTYQRKKFQSIYEGALVDGNKDAAVIMGKAYYSSMSRITRRANGITNIEAKIEKDLKEHGLV